MIRDGQTVSIEYTLKLDSGETADTNVGGEPLSYQHGESEILPDLEQALTGLAVGDEKSVTLAPEQGYGPHHEEAVRKVPLVELPEDARETGAQLAARDDDGNDFAVQVRAIEGEDAVLDFNHPLAGETLHFAVKILAIE